MIGALSAEFEDALTTPQIEACVDRIETQIRKQHPDVRMLFVKPQSPDIWQQHDAARRARGEAP